MESRLPAVAGAFYAGSGDTLRLQIEECFRHELGPGALPVVDESGPRAVIGLVSPHAGLMYSGPCAAWGYAALAADGKPGSVVIVSPNHRGIGAAVALAGASQWETPLGTVHGDLDLTEAIVAACPEARIDDSAHREEHAVEVQLPFLQYLYGDTVHVAAIALSDYRWATVRALGDGIATACRDRDVVIIASTDLSHYVPQERAERQDALILDRIREMDGERLLRAAIERHVSMCGAGPVAAMLQSARALGMDAAKILRYYTSGDIVGASDEVVGYASAVIHARRG